MRDKDVECNTKESPRGFNQGSVGVSRALNEFLRFTCYTIYFFFSSSLPICHVKTAKREKDETVFHCTPGEIRTDTGATKWLGGTIQNLIIFTFS